MNGLVILTLFIRESVARIDVWACFGHQAAIDVSSISSVVVCEGNVVVRRITIGLGLVLIVLAGIVVFFSRTIFVSSISAHSIPRRVVMTSGKPVKGPVITNVPETRVLLNSTTATGMTVAAVTADRLDIESVLAGVRDVSRPVEERKKVLFDISRRKDAKALSILKAVGDARVYLNFVAVEAIGNFAKSSEKPIAAAYLKSKLSDYDAQIACAAIRAYAQLTGVDAIPELASVLPKNRVRADGYQETVCTAAVKALQNICATTAVPALLAELERSEDKGWSMEYGSCVLAALQPIRTLEGCAGAAAYADRLSARIPEDKLAKAYYEKKIIEARKIAGQ